MHTITLVMTVTEEYMEEHGQDLKELLEEVRNSEEALDEGVPKEKEKLLWDKIEALDSKLDKIMEVLDGKVKKQTKKPK